MMKSKQATAFWQKKLSVKTQGRGTTEISGEISRFVNDCQVSCGLCHVFIQHTSASLMITENADPTVRRDIEYFLAKHVKDGDNNYQHNYEGDDDMSAHIRCLLTTTELTVPVADSRLLLGTWQGVYLYEHRYRPMTRHLILTLQGSEQ